MSLKKQMVLPRDTDMKQQEELYNLNLRLYIILLSIFVLTLMLVVFLQNKKYVKIDIYLPEVGRAGFSREVRYIPKSGSRIEKIWWIMNELISGPLDSDNLRVFNPETEIKEIFIEKGIMYINFDWKIVETLQRNYFFATTSIKKTIAKNFSSVKEVRLLVDGVEPILYQGPIVLKLR